MRTQLDAIGCTVYGVDAVALAPVDLQALRQLLYAHRVLVLKPGRLSQKQFCDFAMAFANPVQAPADICCPAHPVLALAAESNPATGPVWHSDGSHHKVPPVVTFLMPRPSADAGGHATQFIDMSEVFAALPARTQRRLEHTELLHAAPCRSAGPVAAVRHPAVITHPHTREKILYANRGHAIAVAGWTPQESERFLGDILGFAEQQRFVRDLAWHAGDIVVWDNRFLQHRTRCGAPNDAWSIAACDFHPLCASQHAAAAA